MIKEIIIDRDTYLEVQNIANKVFYPLEGFMDSADYKNVVNEMRLNNGAPWPIPITLDVPKDKFNDLIRADKVILKNKNNKNIAELMIEDIYKVDLENDVKKIFGTRSINHPGVAKELMRSPFRVGGRIRMLTQDKNYYYPKYSLTPDEVKEKFKQLGWKTITGFQTRNPIHLAHEYLQRIALEVTDGLLIQPLVGWRKHNDFSVSSIIKSYKIMLKYFYPKSNVLFCLLNTSMRYAGPREAIFHAILRRNFGCTHFIIGRDHAGVGNFYGKYDAHKLCDKFSDLGIQILKLHEPYYCKKCRCIVTEKSCVHRDKYALYISGTQIKLWLLRGKYPPIEFMRKEISGILLRLKRENKLLCNEEERNEV